MLAITGAQADIPQGFGSAAAPLLGAHQSGGSLIARAHPLVSARPAASLFASETRARPSLFEAYRGVPGRDGAPHDAARRLLSLIAQAEAGRDGYDAVQHGARIAPPRAPTQLTLAEIDTWIDATPGQPHAIGRYQFIPPTLRRVVGLRGLPPSTRFSAEVQDMLAMVLLEDAGLTAFEAGALDRDAFMRNLARIWAGLPLPNGRSYYEGHAGNRATMTWAAFDQGIAQIWPAR